MLARLPLLVPSAKIRSGRRRTPRLFRTTSRDHSPKRAARAERPVVNSGAARSDDSLVYGGIEAGGTKWVCALADAQGGIQLAETFPTTTPSETMARATRFFLDHGIPDAIGIGCFGPIDLRPSSSMFGWVTTTPKPGWANTDIAGPLRERLQVPVVIDTDVNAAALGEGKRGHGRGLDTFAYVTVGTGIGLGAVANGALIHGLLHPEAGHIRVPHDRKRDPFAGSCPYHGDCFEGLASGQAIRERYGQPADTVTDAAAWRLEADYLALGLLAIIYTLSPQRLIVGGGVMQRQGLLADVRERVFELAGGYPDSNELAERAGIDNYIVAPGLGAQAGITGAIELVRAIDRTRARDQVGAADLERRSVPECPPPKHLDQPEPRRRRRAGPFSQ